jgi:hypothetical protein
MLDRKPLTPYRPREKGQFGTWVVRLKCLMATRDANAVLEHDELWARFPTPEAWAPSPSIKRAFLDVDPRYSDTTRLRLPDRNLVKRNRIAEIHKSVRKAEVARRPQCQTIKRAIPVLLSLKRLQIDSSDIPTMVKVGATGLTEEALIKGLSNVYSEAQDLKKPTYLAVCKLVNDDIITEHTRLYSPVFRDPSLLVNRANDRRKQHRL